MRYVLLFCFFYFFTYDSFGQAFYDNKAAGIKIQEPSGWFISTDTIRNKNLNRFSIDTAQFLRLLDSTKRGLLLRTYFKYSPDSATGLIPTIKIAIRLNNTSTFDGFKNVVQYSIDNFKRSVDDFKMSDTIQIVTLSGKECLYYSCNYSLRLKGGIDVQIRSKFYMIPKGKYFISINFIDDAFANDCSSLYNELLKTIKL